MVSKVIQELIVFIQKNFKNYKFSQFLFLLVFYNDYFLEKYEKYFKEIF